MTGPSASAFVLDASVALAAFFEDEQDEYALAVWRSMPAAVVQVPALWHLEMGNILSRALRAGRISRQALDDCWSRLSAAQIRSLPVTQDAMYWERRAGEWNLSAYDACYLDTALRHRLSLATRDRALVEAARRVGVPLYLNPAKAA